MRLHAARPIRLAYTLTLGALLLAACQVVTPTAPTPKAGASSAARWTPDAVVSLTATAQSEPRASATGTPSDYHSFLPGMGSRPWTPTPSLEPPTATPSPLPIDPPPPPTPVWPEALAGLTQSKLGLHVVRNNDPYIMEFVRRAKPRVMKGVDDLGFLADIKQVSPGTVTVGRLNQANVIEHWPDSTDPGAAAAIFVDENLETYLLNPQVDYWEGWNEFVTTEPDRWQWYAQFEASRACLMQAQGLRAAVGGFAAGTPEYSEMALFLPALEAAHRCGGIFTVHEAVYPIIGCGLAANQAGLIPGAPALRVPAGSLMLRYRFWYEGWLKPRGLGGLPLVISELAVGGFQANSPCNGLGGSAWRLFQDWWVQQGVGPDGPQSYVNILAWYDQEIRNDPYVLGVTIFTAGAIGDVTWSDYDLHDALVPLAHYEVSQP